MLIQSLPLAVIGVLVQADLSRQLQHMTSQKQQLPEHISKTMQASKKCISILGAGTQGRRLAFMVHKQPTNLLPR